MTTREKMLAVGERLATMAPDRMPPELREALTNLQAARGLPVLGRMIPADPIRYAIEHVIPDDDAACALLVDKLIALLLDLRGDELPPFDPGRYGEQAADLHGWGPDELPRAAA